MRIEVEPTFKIMATLMKVNGVSNVNNNNNKQQGENQTHGTNDFTLGELDSLPRKI